MTQFMLRLFERLFRRPAAPDWVEELDPDQRRRLVRNLRSLADPKRLSAERDHQLLAETEEPECAISGSARP